MRPWLAVVFLLSGAAALIYQIAWQRALFVIYGLDAVSATIVVTAFMLGDEAIITDDNMATEWWAFGTYP
jgi:hypothetical protein|tara:strand:+ start:247 stop:456 length:210 start_codon:yes stop_codon:yes gene_type:complete